MHTSEISQDGVPVVEAFAAWYTVREVASGSTIASVTFQAGYTRQAGALSGKWVTLQLL